MNALNNEAEARRAGSSKGAASNAAGYWVPGGVGHNHAKAKGGAKVCGARGRVVWGAGVDAGHWAARVAQSGGSAAQSSLEPVD